MRKWLKKIRGSAVLEAALTIPVVFYVIFFAIELIRMNEIQIKLNAIAEEITMDFVINQSPIGFYDILVKYGMEAEAMNENLQYDLVVYESLSDVMSESPYGGEDIFIPWDTGNDYLVTTEESPVKSSAFRINLTGKLDLSGKPFVITVVYKYQFSSSFVARLFNGGTNTYNGTAYLLWARGVGICENRHKRFNWGLILIEG